MKKIINLMGLFSFSLLPWVCDASCSCQAPIQGPPGSFTAFASDYSLDEDFTELTPENPIIGIPEVNANVNVDHAAASVTINDAGKYFIIFGASNYEEDTDIVVTLGLFKNGVLIQGTELRLAPRVDNSTLDSLSTMIDLQDGDILDLRSTTSDSWHLGTEVTASLTPVTAFMTLFRIAN